MSTRLDWARDGADWPNREHSRFVRAGALRWHVQVMGSGPDLLLVHGTGAATHSWRDLAPLLAGSFRVVAPDLPGHGFTEAPAPGHLSLDGMSRDLATLLDALDVRPELGVGHSAGAAIVCRMSLDGAIAPRAIVSLNGALLPMRGIAGHVFSPVAKALALTPLAPRLFARRARDPTAIERLIRETGSRLDPRGVELYRRLAGNPHHVAAALFMMANWDLHRLKHALPTLTPDLILVVGSEDRAIPPKVAFSVRDLVPGAQIELMRGLGHLAHEEQPGETAALILRQAERAKIIRP